MLVFGYFYFRKAFSILMVLKGPRGPEQVSSSLFPQRLILIEHWDSSLIFLIVRAGLTEVEMFHKFWQLKFHCRGSFSWEIQVVHFLKSKTEIYATPSSAIEKLEGFLVECIFPEMCIAFPISKLSFSRSVCSSKNMRVFYFVVTFFLSPTWKFISLSRWSGSKTISERNISRKKIKDLLGELIQNTPSKSSRVIICQILSQISNSDSFWSN